MPDPAVSFEFFPPGDEAMAQQLWQSVLRLAPLRPSFVSVTYGADGSTRARTHEFVQRVLAETELRVAPHLTCVAAPREEVIEIARSYWQLGVRHLVALRGDAPAGSLSADGRYQPYPGGFAFASDLVGGLRQAGDFEISVAAYPEGHPESGGVDADLENLKRKVDAGARRAITAPRRVSMRASFPGSCP
jgi:methylenetetrahydrofolate reductase (NADPH)